MGKKKNKSGHPLVSIVMGSDSDWPIMEKATSVLKQLGIPFEAKVSSAHRSPERTAEYARSARSRGIKVMIAGAGAAAHLAGAITAVSTLPVIGVPIDSSPLKGMDALLATVQMPPGVPVATMAIGAAGAKNAAIFAAQILALSDGDIEKKMIKYKNDMASQVEKKDGMLQKKLAD